MKKEPIITARSIFHRYRTPTGWEPVIEELNLEIYRGEFLAILGASGVGKSTLIKICAGLLQPTSGVVLFHRDGDGGSSLEATQAVAQGLIGVLPQSEAVKQRQIGMLLQHPILAPWRTVLGNALLPLEIAAMYTPTSRARVENLLLKVGFDEKDFTKFPHQLSGGMQQRLALVMVLSYAPKVLFLDEPLGALDAVTRRQMHQLLLSLWEEERDKTIVFVTHDVHEAILLACRLLILPRKPFGDPLEIQVPFDRPRNFELIYDSRFKELSERIFAVMSGAKS